MCQRSIIIEIPQLDNGNKIQTIPPFLHIKETPNIEVSFI